MDELEVRKGTWTIQEDLLLVNYIAVHGEGRWSSLARSSGLKRTGKSCRLRWLNYLRPDLRRGDITPEEQLLILELHSRWGNRWSKIAQHLPGRTDNEIKNYWRTRVQKHAKQLRFDVSSEQFKHAMKYLWIPKLKERISASADVSRSNDANMSDDISGNGIPWLAERTHTADEIMRSDDDRGSDDISQPPDVSAEGEKREGFLGGDGFLMETLTSPDGGGFSLGFMELIEREECFQSEHIWGSEDGWF